MRKLKIWHIADTQFDVGTSNYSKTRYDEFVNMSRRIIDKAKDENNNQKYDFGVYVGDISELYAPNDTTRTIISNFLLEATKMCKHFIIVDGNHDLKKSSNQIQMSLDGTLDVETNLIQNLVDTLSIDNLYYLKHSGIHTVGGVDYALWSHFDKVNPSCNVYSPWDVVDSNTIDLSKTVELFHDPIDVYKEFNGNVVDKERSAKYVKLSDFKCDLVMGGDIHIPQIHKFGKNKDKTFTYPSSTVLRHFGEGDYITDTTLDVSGNIMHGFNIVEFDLDNIKETIDIKFVPVEQHTLRTTVIFSPDMDISRISDMIDSISKNIKFGYTKKMFIKFDVIDNNKFWVDNGNDIEQTLHELFNNLGIVLVIEQPIGLRSDDTITKYSSEMSVDVVGDVHTIVQNAYDYIDELVKYAKIDKEEKPKVIDSLRNIFVSEFYDVYDNSQHTNSLTFNKLTINNFGSFTDTTFVNLKDKNSVVKINGINGGGKSTLYQFISYMMYDITNQQQNPLHRQKTALTLFNDKTSDDEMVNEMSFSVNGMECNVIKKITRVWKRGYNRENSGKYWASYVSNVKFDYSLTDHEGNFYNSPDDIYSYFNNLLCVDDAYTMLFVNGNTISNLLNSKADVLTNRILNGIGINFMDAMLSRYDDTRSDKMQMVTKHKETNTDLNKIISDSKQTIKQTEIVISDVETKLNINKGRKDRLVSDRERLKSTISYKKNETIRDIDNDINKTNLEIENLNGKLLKSKELIETLGKDVLTTEQISEIEANNNELTERNNTLLLENKSLETSIVDKRGEIKLLMSELSNYIRSKKQEIKDTIAKIDKMIGDNTQTIKDISDNVGDIIDSIKEENNTKLTALRDISKRLNEDKAQINSHINKNLSDSKNIDKKIAGIERDIVNLQNTLSKLNLQKECGKCKFILNMSDGNKFMDSRFSDIKNDNITDVETKILLLQTELNDLYLLTFDNTEFYNEIERIDYKLSDNEVKINLLSDTIKEQTKYNTRQLKQYFIDGNFEYLSVFNVDFSTYIKSLTDTNNKIKSLQSKISILNTELINEDILITDTNFISYRRKIDLLIGFLNKFEDEMSKNDINISDNKKIIKDNTEKLEDNTKKQTILSSYLESLSIISDEINFLKPKIELLNTDKEILAHISRLEALLGEVGVVISKNEESLLEAKKTIYIATKTIEESNTKIEDNIKYDRLDKSLKLYKKLVGKNGFPQYLFSTITASMNNILDINLRKLNFTPVFYSDGTIKMFDKVNGVIRDSSRLSGMQSTFTGLSIIDMMRAYNKRIKLNQVFIDEITGTLNDGSDLPYEASNYQQEMKEFIHHISTSMKSLYIIDHVISDLGEAHRMTIVPSSNNSCTKIIDVENKNNEDLF